MNIITNKESKYMLMSLIGNGIFGLSFLFSKLAMNVADPIVLIAVRFTVAFIVMNLLKILNVMPISLTGKNIKPVIMLGIYQPVIYFICESYGIKYSSSSFAGIIIALIPIVGLILGTIMLKERRTLAQILFSILSVSGVIVMTISDDAGNFQLKGLLFLLGAVVSGAMFNIQSRKISNDFTAFERTYVMFGVGTVTFILISLIKTRLNMDLWIEPLSDGEFWVSILYLSCISSVGAFLLLNKALDVLEVSKSLVFANVTTVISVVAGVVILKEHFGFIQVIGIIMTIVGVYGASRPQSN